MSGSRRSPNAKRPAVPRRIARDPLSRSEIARIVWFAVAYTVLRWSLVTQADSPALETLRETTALWAGALLRLVGVRVVMAGCSIVSGDATTTVSPACVPVSALAIGVALVLASGRLSTWGRALWSVVVAVVVLCFNVLRIAVVALLAAQHSPLLDAAHIYVLPVALALVAVAVWLLAERVGPHAT